MESDNSAFFRKLGLTVAAVVACALLSARAKAAPIPDGTVMASTGNGLVSEFTPLGAFVTQLDTTKGSSIFTTGSAFDIAGNFYVTDFNGNDVTKFDPSGTLIGSFGSGYGADDESILFDATGHVYVGQADGTHHVLKFSSTGAPIATFAPAVEDRGTDWITLAADQCTLFYTSEGHLIKRFNVCTNTQLADFNTSALPGAAAYALRIRPNGDVLVADSTVAIRLNAAGTQVQSYTCPGSAGIIFALNLDPDGSSFWTADGNGAICKIDIASGTVLENFSAASVPNFSFLGGLTIKGEILVAQAKLVLTPDVAANLTGTSHTVNASLTGQKFCHGGTNPTTPPTACNLLSDCPDHSAGTSCNEAGYHVFFAIAGTCSGGTNSGAACLSNSDCNSNVCDNVNVSPNFGTTGVKPTNAAGVATFTYPDSGGVGQDTIIACADTDIFGAGPDDPNFVTCANASDNTVSNTVVKYWANVNLSPATAFNLAGTNHTVTATVNAASFCHGGTNPTSPPTVCTSLADCPDQSAGTSCDQSGYNVFFAVPGTCTAGTIGAACTSDADCGGGGVCGNTSGSVNFGTTGESSTNASGVATFTYSDTGGAGLDVIRACADTDLIEAPDDASYAACANSEHAVTEDTLSNPALKFWLANFVTGGGKVAGPNGTSWTFGGNVGPNPSGPGISGQWELVFHPAKGQALACHWDNFSFLDFFGPPTTSPPSTHNTAFFIADTGICNDGSTPTIDVVEVDNHDSGIGADTLEVLGPGNLQIFPAQPLSSGNIQVHNEP